MKTWYLYTNKLDLILHGFMPLYVSVLMKINSEKLIINNYTQGGIFDQFICRFFNYNLFF